MQHLAEDRQYRMCISDRLRTRHGIFLAKKALDNFDESSFPLNTHLAYVALCKSLSLRGFSKVIEVGPGSLSTMAIAIKSACLEGKLRYVGIDVDPENGRALVGFLDRLGLDGEIWTLNFTFDLFEQECVLTSCRTLWCFEHSLEDLALQLLLKGRPQHLGRNWSGVWSQFRTEPTDQFTSTRIEEAVSTVLATVMNLHVLRREDAIVVHHFLSPAYRAPSLLSQLDQAVLCKLREALSVENSESIGREMDFNEEIFRLLLPRD